MTTQVDYCLRSSWKKEGAKGLALFLVTAVMAEVIVLASQSCVLYFGVVAKSRQLFKAWF